MTITRAVAAVGLAAAALVLAACGVPLQDAPEPLPSDVVPTTAFLTSAPPSVPPAG